MSKPGAGWLDVPEAGSRLGMQVLRGLCRVLGRAPVRAIVRWMSWYWVLLSPRTRRVSREYQQRLQPGARVGLREIHAHVSTFALCVLDRYFLLVDGADGFQTELHGREHFEALMARKEGAILMGAHLGSFEFMRATRGYATRPINVVGYFRNAEAINRVLAETSPEAQTRLIHIEPGQAAPILTLKERIDAGELVAMLADRIGLNDKSVDVPFLGEPAPFPAGPLILASVLRCPVYLIFGLYEGGARYSFHIEAFAERIELPRKSRGEGLVRYAGAFAERLEHYCRKAPLNWFNFYDFWAQR